MRFERNGREAATLVELVRPGDTIDYQGVASALGGAPSLRSFVTGVARIPLTHEVTHGPLEATLSDLVEAHADAAFALSGGVDAALLLALARRRDRRPIAYTLRPRLAGYDEHEAALHVAHALGVELRIVDADEQDFIDALPDALRAIETPLWNLHPVARLLLARRVAADGFRALITGDGADQRCSGDDGRDYLPLVGALTRAAGLQLVCPYLHVELAIDPEKKTLRSLLARDLPDIAAAKKQPRLAPIAIDAGAVTTRMLAALLGVR